jgi:hypothetical protein
MSSELRPQVMGSSWAESMNLGTHPTKRCNQQSAVATGRGQRQRQRLSIGRPLAFSYALKRGRSRRMSPSGSWSGGGSAPGMKVGATTRWHSKTQDVS